MRFQYLSTCSALVLALTMVPLAAEAQFRDETTVVVVEVPVNVIRDGAPVRDLTIDDFELFDGRKRQDITGFEVVDLSLVGDGEGQTAVNEVSASGRRHFLLVFDLSLSDPTSVERARQSARQLLQQGLHPADLVAVATYSQARGASLILNFSPNREQAEVAIATLGLAEPAHKIVDPLTMMIGEDGPQGASTGATSRADAMIEEMTRDFKTLTGRVARDQERNQAMAMTDALESLANLMRSVEGRKHVVFLSEGFPSELFTGVEDVERQLEIQREIEFGQTQRVDATERFGDTQASSALQQMVRAFQEADCAVQTVDIGGLEAGPDANAKMVRNEGLFRMANETGGEFYQNYNNLTDAMDEVLEHTSVTYILAFQPQKLEMDGKFHKLRVKLKDDLKGVRLVHRPGYFPPTPYAQLSAAERKLMTASTILSGPEGGSFLTSAMAAPFPSPTTSAYVPVLIEIDGPSLLDGHTGDTLVTEIYAYALDESGTVSDFFVRRLGLDTANARDALMASGFKYYGHLELDPGEYAVRVLVRNSMTGESSLVMVPLSVPDMGSGAQALLPPMFPEPLGKWLFGRESVDEQLDGVAYPFMLGDEPFVPAAKPLVGKKENTICLAGYSLGDGSLSVQGQLFALDGTPVGEAEIELLDRPDTGVTGFDRLIADLRPPRVPNGEYLLLVTVTDLATGDATTSSVEVVIGG